MPSTKKLLQAAAGNAGGDSLYVEDVFSTYLYDGTGAAHTITNGIDLSGEGGLTWIKARDIGYSHQLFDTERGATKQLYSNTTDGETTAATSLTSFNSDGFSLGALNGVNNPSQTFASWTFRKAEKFFDVVTYTGNGVNGRQLPHSLGSTPGMVVCKRTDTGQNWILQHKSLDLSGNKTMYLNNTDALAVANDYWNSTHASSTAITLSGDADINGSGGTYVAYVFASDAGGFGDDGDENIIKCGSWNENSTNNVTIDCGFEPAFVMFKCADAASPWYMVDSMRGIPTPSSGTATGNYINTVLQAQASTTETSANAISLTSTGFTWYADGRLTNTAKWIYIALRRPMKTPEAGTEVFAVDTPDSTSPPKYRSSFPVDMAWFRSNINSTGATDIANRLTGTKYLNTNSNAVEGNQNSYTWDFQNGWYNDQGTETNNRSWMFKRATGFFDVVAYTGSGSVYLKDHNLGVVPEMMIVKNRNGAETSWSVYHSALGADYRVQLNSDSASSATSDWDNASDVGTAPTATQFNVKAASVIVNNASYSYVAYLFATLAGVSKVGSYTGTGADLNVDCGFSAGARFILIKRTNSTGNWFYWDYERGITAGNDPYLLLNSTAAQVTNTDYIDPLSSGFTVTSGASFDGLNNSGGNYIFLAIA
jgi:hypothetical protein